MSRQSGMRDPFPIVSWLGDRFRTEKHGLRDAKALVLLVAQSGPADQAWDGAADLAYALGFSEDYIERIYREAYGPRPPGERTRACTPQTPCPRRRT